MTNKEILLKAIKRAVLNDIHFEQWLDNYDLMRIEYNEHFNLIFSHEFAKAFWGYDSINVYDDEGIKEYLGDSWEYHLQQMVLEEEPLKYLEKFLN